jgi:hypothetical protein
MQPSSLTAGLRSYYNGLSSTPSSGQAESQLNDFNKMAPNSTSILADYEKQAGVTGYQTEASALHKNILDTENLINAVPDAINARTSNALVSGGQAQRLTAAEQDPLNKQLGVLNTRYSGTQNDLQFAEGQASKYTSLDVGDINNWSSSLQGRLSDALNREEQQRQAAAQAAQQKALQDLIAQQNAQMNAQMAASTKAYNDAMARTKYLLNTSKTVINQGSYNPQQTAGINILQPTMSGNILQPARNTVQVTAPASRIQNANPGFSLNTSGGQSVATFKASPSQGIRLR